MNASYSYVIDRSSVGTTLIPSEALLLERRVVVLNREVSAAYAAAERQPDR